MQAIPAGTKGSFSLLVTPDYLGNRFKDAMLPRVALAKLAEQLKAKFG